VTQRTDARGVITAYTYDGLNRPYQVSYNVGSTGVPATPTVSYTYGTSSASNNNGRLLSVADGSNTETYSYDILGQVTQAQKLISGSTYTLGYAYNLAGELTSITYPSGRVVGQNYDAIGRLSTIFSGATNYASSYRRVAHSLGQ
jgi:YD repeat-containing protein